MSPPAETPSAPVPDRTDDGDFICPHDGCNHVGYMERHAIERTVDKAWPLGDDDWEQDKNLDYEVLSWTFKCPECQKEVSMT